jgi:hypothetical protein
MTCSLQAASASASGASGHCVRARVQLQAPFGCEGASMVGVTGSGSDTVSATSANPASAYTLLVVGALNSPEDHRTTAASAAPAIGRSNLKQLEAEPVVDVRPAEPVQGLQAVVAASATSTRSTQSPVKVLLGMYHVR